MFKDTDKIQRRIVNKYTIRQTELSQSLNDFVENIREEIKASPTPDEALKQFKDVFKPYIIELLKELNKVPNRDIFDIFSAHLAVAEYICLNLNQINSSDQLIQKFREQMLEFQEPTQTIDLEIISRLREQMFEFEKPLGTENLELITKCSEELPKTKEHTNTENYEDIAKTLYETRIRFLKHKFERIFLT